MSGAADRIKANSYFYWNSISRGNWSSQSSFATSSGFDSTLILRVTSLISEDFSFEKSDVVNLSALTNLERLPSRHPCHN